MGTAAKTAICIWPQSSRPDQVIFAEPAVHLVPLGELPLRLEVREAVRGPLHGEEPGGQERRTLGVFAHRARRRQ